ncbi:hypothetical protein TBLA_0B01260 [Henningerozyma blattae CBS 6284]|uniref:RING-type E3 ubiquitin transferase n=1 Tax=Henningerozyma blattae (strain ATCC 34711 / CBS 6284 / DSM 70876 / NBRC 10599 / NRRL Y-10934 / UCD 77-7) TaxID=1071380 RepID=I2GXW7_HENB6|nr:hypothetical protein TBLA_0B01260 [Tetrapisispora blattae CBS 6284]CCH58969.1 hypothetical protein TBLA_0B01260 [Tetrapisispora blattae CBS 6284]
MYTPVPFNSNNNSSNNFSSTDSLPNSNSTSNLTSHNHINSTSNNNNNVQTRRRGASMNMLLSTFGIRQQQSASASSSNQANQITSSSVSSNNQSNLLGINGTNNSALNMELTPQTTNSVTGSGLPSPTNLSNSNLNFERAHLHNNNHDLHSNIYSSSNPNLANINIINSSINDIPRAMTPNGYGNVRPNNPFSNTSSSNNIGAPLSRTDTNGRLTPMNNIGTSTSTQIYNNNNNGMPIPNNVRLSHSNIITGSDGPPSRSTSPNPFRQNMTTPSRINRANTASPRTFSSNNLIAPTGISTASANVTSRPLGMINNNTQPLATTAGSASSPIVITTAPNSPSVAAPIPTTTTKGRAPTNPINIPGGTEPMSPAVAHGFSTSPVVPQPFPNANSNENNNDLNTIPHHSNVNGMGQQQQQADDDDDNNTDDTDEDDMDLGHDEFVNNVQSLPRISSHNTNTNVSNSTISLRQSNGSNRTTARSTRANTRTQTSGSHVPHHDMNAQLPISISLTSSDSNNNNNNNSNNDSSINLSANHHPINLHATKDNPLSLKNLRHFIYGPNQKDADKALHLESPPNQTIPAKVDEETLKNRKTKYGLFSIRLTPFIDSHSSTSHAGLFFDPVVRNAGGGSQLVIGRYTERVREAISKIPEQFHPVVFKSKVVSRTHGCFKVDSQGTWYIKDVKSSSGTFLNHQRLSPASALSKDVMLHDGDILQLGMDFRGGTEEIYRCVKMRVELNKSWKRKANAFNKEAIQRMKNLQKMTLGLEGDDCSICLSKIKPCQAIFISPCSHSWHFHCIRRLVMLQYPQFVCPNCRSTCDLESSLESSDSENEDIDIDMGGNDDDDDGDDDDEGDDETTANTEKNKPNNRTISRLNNTRSIRASSNVV